MSETKVKLCGMFRDQDIEAVNAACPDMVGFVVDFPQSHRSVTPGRLAELAPQVAPGITRVGVFVDEDVAQVAALAQAGLIDAAQLHGGEDEAYLADLRALAPSLTLIQAFRIGSTADVARAQESSADLVLLDSGQGSGQAFDWTLAAGVKRPFILAGGLTPANVAAAIRQTQPWGVDMSSGIETDRLKDPDKIAAAVTAVRTA